MTELPEHVRRNREQWDSWADEYEALGRRGWAAAEPSWGIWSVPESRVRMLPDDLDGCDAIELGCGTAYVSSWLARRGARPTGLDVSEEQLATARRFQEEFGIEFPLVHGSAEALPFQSESFDLVVSEYGASIWADPFVWIAEAARVLRPEGHIVLLVNGTILMLCLPEADADLPAGTRFQRPYFGMHRWEWDEDESVDFHIGYGDWIRVFGENGLEVEELIELQGDPETPPSRHNLFTPAWASMWPAEEIWRARKTG
jgi:SAM-dependent methyltransferase